MSSNNTVKEDPVMVRKIIKMYMGTDENPKSPDKADLQCCLLCAIALDDNKLAKKIMEMGASASMPSDPKHIWLLQQYGYFTDI